MSTRAEDRRAGDRSLKSLIMRGASPALRAYTLLLVTASSNAPHLAGPAGPALRSVSPRRERQPGDRPPAPGDLGLVQAFVNSRWDLDRHEEDQFTTAPALAEWLVKRDLLAPGTRLSQADLKRALAVREGLHALLFVNNGANANQGAIERLNQALARPGLFVQLDPQAAPDFEARRRDLDAALGLIATIVAVAQIDGRWSRLKACRGDHCGWAFYDHSRNQASSWCAMSVCGSRAKAREYRRRKRRSHAA
jgi:predicted RNA-binding Zn ribbon-like protein